MWISRRTDYATRAVLALARAPRDRALTIEELARRTAVPPRMLEQVLPVMRRDGIVRAERGRYGGYRLNKDPADLTLERVVRLFEGQLAPIACATAREPEPCPMEVGCSMRAVWTDLRDVIVAHLRATTFAALAEAAGGPWVAPPDAPAVPAAP